MSKARLCPPVGSHDGSTGVFRSAELDWMSGKGSDYDAVKAQMVTRVPEGYALLAIYAEEYYAKDEPRWDSASR